MNLKRILTFGAIAFAVFFLIQEPNEAAKLVKVAGENASEWVAQAGDSLAKFLKSLI